MRVTTKGQKPIDLPTGAKVDIDDWDTQTEYAKIKAVNATEINRIIDDYKVKIKEKVGDFFGYSVEMSMTPHCYNYIQNSKLRYIFIYYKLL